MEESSRPHRSGIFTDAAVTGSILADGALLRLDWAGATDRGRRRDTNQDSLLMAFPLFVVADGMGGHAGGEIASQRTVARLREAVAAGTVDEAAIERALERAVADLDDHVEATDEGTGTTLTGVFLADREGGPQWIVLNIGDSRVYLLREGKLAQITTDHSVVQELIDAGRLSPEEAEGHPYSNVITRAVGVSDLLPPDYITLEAMAGDRLVICSDGLTKELTDYGIQHFLTVNDEPAAAVEAMIHAALENGGRDNVTLIVVQASEADAAGSPSDASAETATDGDASETDAE